MPLNRVLRKCCLFLPAGVWYGVIFRFSAQTGASSSAVSDGLAFWLLRRVYPAFFLLNEPERTDLLLAVTFFIRKAAHMAVYFILAALLMWAVQKLTERTGRRAGAVISLCALLAGLDEFHQTFVTGRSGQLRDVCIDLAGCGCFLLLWLLICRIRKKRRKPALPCGKTP